MDSPTPGVKRILFISNGHGEDNHSGHIIQTLRELQPTLEIAAMPIVGEGNAYRRLNVPLIVPTQTLPSGGFTYVNRLLLFRDIGSGLVGLTWRQIRAIRRYRHRFDLIMATGDIVSQAFAYLSGKPYVSFISCLSSLYEGRLRVGPFIGFALRANRCLTVITKDPYTAQDLRQQGIAKATFGGIPAMDRLKPSGRDLQLHPDLPMIALLPGSRWPESERNFALQLRWVRQMVKLRPKIQFRAALVPNLMERLPQIADGEGWRYHDPGQGMIQLIDPEDESVRVLCCSDAFADIVYQTTLVIGMAGLAVEQAAALGKPIIHIAGEGPQFNWAFAEAQTRLIGETSLLIGSGPATPETLQEAAQRCHEILADPEYLARCDRQGRQRFGPPGASHRICQILLSSLGYSTAGGPALA